MTIKEFKKQAVILLGMTTQKINIILAGPPGIGKSQAVEQIALQMGFEVLLIHCVTSDPTDMKGLPVTWTDELGNKRAEWIPFGDLLKIITADKPLLVFFDDFGQAPTSVQAAIMQLIQARQLNGYKVSDLVRFIFATNRREDAAGVKAILSTIKTRGLIIEIEASVDEFCEFIREDPGCHPIVHYFAQAVLKTPSMGDLFKFEPTKDMSNTCIPRTLHQSGAVLLEYETLSLVPHPEVIYGLIGKAMGAHLLGYLKIWKEIPDPREFLKNPRAELIPARADAKFAFMGQVMHVADATNADNVMEFVNMLPNEFGVYFVSTLISMMKAKAKREGITDHQKRPVHPVMQTTAFREFAMNFHELITFDL